MASAASKAAADRPAAAPWAQRSEEQFLSAARQMRDPPPMIIRVVVVRPLAVLVASPGAAVYPVVVGPVFS
jgi:hypothetical protein